MIAKNIIKQPKSIVEITITAPWTDLQATWDATLQKMAADIELPGFRKGAAPLAMAEQNLGIKLQDEVLKVAMPQFLIEALKGTDIVPIDYPKYDLTSFVKGTQLQYKATITNRPQISVGNYKAIKVVRPASKSVTDEEVNKAIDDLYKRWKTKQPASPSGGLGGPSVTQNQPGQTGSINFQPGQTQVTPTNGQADVPNDEFARAMGALSITDLKGKIRKDLESNVSYNNELDFEEAILQEVEKITT
ncbi:MAG: trigger factor family protein, partial [Patescibacteria group bacterium]